MSIPRQPVNTRPLVRLCPSNGLGQAPPPLLRPLVATAHHSQISQVTQPNNLSPTHSLRFFIEGFPFRQSTSTFCMSKVETLRQTLNRDIFNFSNQCSSAWLLGKTIFMRYGYDTFFSKISPAYAI